MKVIPSSMLNNTIGSAIKHIHKHCLPYNFTVIINRFNVLQVTIGQYKVSEDNNFNAKFLLVFFC